MPWNIVNNTQDWLNQCVSLDGTLLYAYNSQSQVFYSTNSGATFSISNGTSGNLTGIQCSSSGQYVFVCNSQGQVFYSTNSGATFSISTISTPTGSTGNFTGITCGPGGQYVFVCNSQGQVFSSYNFGATFSISNGTSGNLTGITFILGGFVFVCNSQGQVFSSYNFGATFSISTGTSGNLTGITGGPGGQYVYVCNSHGQVFYSTNSGATFSISTGTSGNLTGISCSKASYKYIYVCSTTGIYYSNNSGLSFILDILTTSLNFTNIITYNNTNAFAISNKIIYKIQVTPPTNVAASPGINSVNLTWNPVSGATSYNVLYGTTPSYGNTKIVSTNSGTITGLTPGTIYNFIVQAVEGITISSNSNNVTSIPNLAPPTNVVATPGVNSVFLNWNPVSGATSYNILYGTTTSYGNNKTVSTNSGTVIGLTPGIIYNFAVQAVVGSTISSNSVNVTSIPNYSPNLHVLKFPPFTKLIINYNKILNNCNY